MHAKVKAVSPLVAALLLIMVGIAGAVLVYLWLTGFVGRGMVVPSTMKTQFKIEAAEINATGNYTIVYTRNIGSITIDCRASNVTVYVYDSNTGELVAVDGSANFTCGDDYVLEPGELGIVNATVKGLEEGKYYDVKLVIGGIEYVYPGVRAE